MSLTLSLVDPVLETLDPNPDIWQLFSEFDERFFNKKLTQSCVELNWSSNKMTSTAGLCSWNSRTSYACIKLSTPLLQLRSRADLVETLLHEMIHAFLFVTHEDDNHESHGLMFHMHMFRINREAKTNITVYHTFHNEVRYYQRHVWRCNGPCKDKKPYYGYVRRASNRKPGPYDFWWAKHEKNCGGSFVKISEPDPFRKKKASKSQSKPEEINLVLKISDYFETSPKTNTSTKSDSPQVVNIEKVLKPKHSQSSNESNIKDIRSWLTPIKPSFVPFSGKGIKLGSAVTSKPEKKKLKTDLKIAQTNSLVNCSDLKFLSLGNKSDFTTLNDSSDIVTLD